MKDSAVYNVVRHLPDFINSIEAQTHPLDDIEVIIVDDGNTDDMLGREYFAKVNASQPSRL